MNLSDVAVPEVIDDLGKVDVVGEGPGHVLPDPRGRVEAAGSALVAPLVENLWVNITSHAAPAVRHAGALVRPHLSHFRQVRVPAAR